MGRGTGLPGGAYGWASKPGWVLWESCPAPGRGLVAQQLSRDSAIASLATLEGCGLRGRSWWFLVVQVVDSGMGR